MTPEDSERLQAVTDALARMVRRQTEIESRLARIESTLKIAPPSPVPPSVPVVTLAPHPPPSTRPKRQVEDALGLTWLSRIGVVTVVLALAFFFEYAFENHWVTEWARVALGLICGAGSLFFGEWFWRRGQRTFAQALTAAGIVFLYLSFWAAFALYGLIPQALTFGLMLLTTGAAGMLALRYEGAAIALLGLSGGYATPLLLGDLQSPWFVLSYTLILNLTSGMASRARRWPWIEVLALAGTVMLYASQRPFSESADTRWVYAGFLLVYYAQFTSAPARTVCAAAQILAGSTLVQVLRPEPGALVLVLTLVVGGLAAADRRGWASAAGASFAGFWLAYFTWRAVSGANVVALPLAVLTAGFLVFLLWPAWRAGYRHQRLRATDLTILALSGAFYFGTGYALLQSHYRGYEGLFAVTAASISGGAARLLWGLERKSGMLAAGIAGVLLVLAAPIQLVGYRVTLAWALEAAAVSWIGMRLAAPRAVYAAGAVFVLTMLRLGFVDGTMYPNPGAYSEFVNARFFAFVVSAASLWAAAWWTRREQRFAAAAYICGHLVLLWGLGLEVSGWAERSAAPPNVHSAVSASLSVLAAIYALGLVAAGVSQRSALTRLLGIVLIAVVVIKLYLYDVWLLGQFYRMAAFAILGVLLLVMSYFYSRFRHSIEHWWRI